MSTPVPSAIQAPVSRRLEWLAIGLLSAAVFAARWALHPIYLWDWDCVAFADALHHFDVTRNQPQPPGFLLFILLGRAAYALLHDEAAALSLVSALASAATVPLLWRLGRRWLELQNAKVWLLWWLTLPTVWFYGALPLSYASEGLTVLALMVLLDGAAPAWLVGLGWGLAGGVRVSTYAVMGLPVVWLRRRSSGREWLALCAGFLLGVLVWLVPTALLSGGWQQFRACNSIYGWGFFWSESIVAGNWRACWQHLLGLGQDCWDILLPGVLPAGSHTAALLLLPWLAVLSVALWAWRKVPLAEPDVRGLVPLWLAGGTAYLVAFHMGQPGYLLALLPAAGLLVLAALRHAWRLLDRSGSGLSWDRRGHLVAASLLVAWNLASFASPEGPFTAATLRRHDAEWGRLTQRVRETFPVEGTLFLHFGMFRQAAWYLPEYRHCLPLLIAKYPGQFPIEAQNYYVSQHRRIDPPRWFCPTGFRPTPVPLDGVQRLVVLDATATWVYTGNRPLFAWPRPPERAFCWVLDVAPGSKLVYAFGSWQVVAPPATEEFGAGR